MDMSLRLFLLMLSCACADARTVKVEYGSDYYLDCPSRAYSLEFAKPREETRDEIESRPQVLWKRGSNPTRVSDAAVRGVMRDDVWRMNQITYEHVGYYTFKDRSGTYISSINLKVEEAHQYIDIFQGEHLDITLDVDLGYFVMTFMKDGNTYEEVLMDGGEPNIELHSIHAHKFDGRLQKLDGPTLHVSIEDLQPSDSGTYTFYDGNHKVALVVHVEVTGYAIFSSYVEYIVTAVSILLVVLCCCYVRKRCCKKTTGKNRSVPDGEAAPDVLIYNHDPQDHTQPSTAAHPSASHGPTYPYPLYHNETGRTSQQPLVPGSEVPHMSSSQPEAGTTASQDPPPYESFLSSDAEPQFELKETTFPSAPLSSDTSCADVYTSDKLNFL